jgi:hypothetical protein
VVVRRWGIGLVPKVASCSAGVIAGVLPCVDGPGSAKGFEEVSESLPSFSSRFSTDPSHLSVTGMDSLFGRFT